MQKAGLADRELMRVAEQQHETDGADGHRAGRDADAERSCRDRPADRAMTSDDERSECERRLRDTGDGRSSSTVPAVKPARPNTNTPPRTSRNASSTPVDDDVLPAGRDVAGGERLDDADAEAASDRDRSASGSRP